MATTSRYAAHLIADVACTADIGPQLLFPCRLYRTRQPSPQLSKNMTGRHLMMLSTLVRLAACPAPNQSLAGGTTGRLTAFIFTEDL